MSLNFVQRDSSLPHSQQLTTYVSQINPIQTRILFLEYPFYY